MEPQLHYPVGPDGACLDDAGEMLVRIAAGLILRHQRNDGSVATRRLARQLAPAAQACNVPPPVLLCAVVSQLSPQAARRLTDAVPPASLVPGAPWSRKGCLYRTLDALPPLRWSRYRLGRSRYAWVRQRAADRLGLDAFTMLERATDTAIARFASVVSLRRFAHLFARDADFRERTAQLVRTHATPELGNPSGAEQRLNMVALSDLSAWQVGLRQAGAHADHQLGAELVMLSIPATVFDAVTATIRGLMDQHDGASDSGSAPVDPALEAE